MSPRLHNFVDRFGATGSLVCAVHCALMPLLLAAIPSLGLAAWLGDGFEQGFVVFASLMGIFSLAMGWRRHRRLRALGVMLLGLAALWTGLLYEPVHHGSMAWHAVVMTLGGVLIGSAHVINLRLNHVHVHTASCAHLH